MFKKTGLGGEWYETVLAGIIVLAVGATIVWFLTTRLGLSIRATGNNMDMVRASSINPTFTIMIGLSLSNSLTALSGAMVGQYQKAADINGGSGIVVIALACLIIGETVMGRRSIVKGVAAAIVGSMIYRLIYAFVLRTQIVPVQGLKLLTAIVVAAAIAFPTLKEWFLFEKRKRRPRKGGR
jgi:putative ABC transport system permease protein